MKDKSIVELIIVLVLVAWGLWALNKNPTPVVDNQTAPTTDTSTGVATTQMTPATLTYAQALVKYKNYRIQLGENCQASPNNVTYKNGVNIMIDNRSSVARTVKVGSSFSIKPWGFQIVKLYSATLPATWYVDCGTSQNVATILIQK